MKFLFALLACLSALPALAENTNPHAQKVGEKRLSLALAGIQALDANEVCSADLYTKDIVELVQRASYSVKADTLKAFLGKVSPDSSITANLAFRAATNQVSLHREENTLAEIKTALTGTVYHKFGQGAYGSPFNVTLHADGSATTQTLELLDDAPWYRWNEGRIQWTVTKQKSESSFAYVLTIDGVAYRLETQETGEHWWVPVGQEAGYANQEILSTSPSECEA